MENRLIQWIYDKPYGGLSNILNRIKHKMEFNKFLNLEIRSKAPDVDMLWTIADFLRLLKIVYFYNPDTTKDHMIYYDPKMAGSTGFVIVKNNIEIKFILRDTTPNITIDIRDRANYKVSISKISFDDGNAVIRDQTDAEIFNTLNNLIMEWVDKLLVEYYDKKH